MKKLFFILTIALSIGAQAERIDSTQFVAFYNYTIQTQDDEGQNVTDSLRLALLVGTRATYCTTVLTYNREGRPSKEMLNAFIMHFQNVLTDMGNAEVVTIEPIYPYRYETPEPMAKVDWTLTEDTLTISGLLCHRATGKLYGKQWTVYYTEEIPSSAGPWKLRGLPGMIVKAEDAEGIHCFELYETKNVVRGIGTVSNPDYQKLSRKKLMEYKKKTLGNPRYVKEPTYYVPKLPDDYDDLTYQGTVYHISARMLVPQKSHVYQPLELE